MKIHVAEQTPRPLNSLVTLAMAIFKRSNGFALTKQCWSYLVGIHLLFGTLPGCSFNTPAFKPDNSVTPVFEADKQGRVYASVSIHPDGERWIVSECVKTPIDGQSRCDLFLYNIRTRRYQRFQLSSAYSYTGAKFSPSGRWVVAVRRPIPRSDTYEDQLQSFKESEILMMRPDGRDFRICAIPKGHLKFPSLSHDELKIAYWESAATRRPSAKTTFASFDVHEHDLQNGTSTLFAGTHRFFQVDGLNYLNNHQLLISAFGPAAEATDMYEYLSKFNFSEVYLLERGQSRLPDPIYTTPKHARVATLDQSQSIYLIGEHKKFGRSLFRFNQQPAHWRIPGFIPGVIGALIASPNGAYVAFIYPVNLSRVGDPTKGLGIFDLSTEQWISINLSQFESTGPDLIPQAASKVTNERRKDSSSDGRLPP